MKNDGAIRPGMGVVGEDGERLGTVAHVASDGFLVQRGRFFPREYVASSADVDRVDGSVVRLRGGEATLRAWSPPGEVAVHEALAPAPEDFDAHGSGYLDTAPSEVRLRVHEEELVPDKHLRLTGRVRLVKDVKTEYRTLTVPVRHEELRIERIPAGAEDVGVLDDVSARIEPSQTTITLLEEVPEVRVVPRVRERVRLVKTVRVEERKMSADVRREVVSVDRDS